MFLCCGDALFDLFAEPEAAAGSVTLNGHVGGSPLNVAIGLARFGNRTAYLAKNSQDVFGRRIARFLAANGVSTEHLVESSRNSTLAIVSMRADGSADYAFYTDGTADCSLDKDELPMPLPEDIAAIHVGSYSTATQPTASTLLALTRREAGRRFISYDPNIRASIEPDLDVWRQQLAEFSATADLVKASDEDLAQLYPDRSEADFAEDCLGRGAALVFVTRGSAGATGYSKDGRVEHIGGLSIDVVDTVGAGDTFQAACLHWLAADGALDAEAASRADLVAMLDFAVRAAALTCTRRGADLPTLADIAAFGRTV